MFKHNYLVNIYDVYDVLTDNVHKLSKTLQIDFNSTYLPIKDDIAYIIGDAIRDRRNKSYWELRRTPNDEEIFMPLLEPKRELKPSVYPILENSGLICEYTPHYDVYTVIE